MEYEQGTETFVLESKVPTDGLGAVLTRHGAKSLVAECLEDAVALYLESALHIRGTAVPIIGDVGHRTIDSLTQLLLDARLHSM